jgi:hypothetical protein
MNFKQAAKSLVVLSVILKWRSHFPLKTEAQKNCSFDPLLWVGYIGAACGVLLLLEAELAGSEFFLFPLAMIVILILIVDAVALASVQESAK